MTSPITTHVLDTSRGRPARGVEVELFIERDGKLVSMAKGHTDDDGRLRTLLIDGKPLERAVYVLRFGTKAYFDGHNERTFYPYAMIAFEIVHPNEHYHVPLLLNAYGYSTYRGS